LVKLIVKQKAGGRGQEAGGKYLLELNFIDLGYSNQLVLLVDMPVITSINRHQWDIKGDFEIRGQQVWLSETGRRKFIDIYERRKTESWKHPVTGYSLTYRRLLELEVRLLEKEWSGEGGLFGQLILR
jgi:CRISPR-associated protein Cas1